MTTDDAATKVRTYFTGTFGTEPDGIWAAPGRVNLIGEHTDYNGGLALPIALEYRTWAAARARDDDRLVLASAGWPQTVEVAVEEIAPGNPGDWARYPAGSLWALRTSGFDVGGLEVAFWSEVPIGAGLSSSAAIEVALAVAARDLFGVDVANPQLADLCRQGENQIAQAPTGGMDQLASLCCTPGHALRMDCADGDLRQVPFDPPGLRLLVIDTQASHALGDGQYGQRRADCEQACTLLGIGQLRDIAPSDLDQALAGLPTERLQRRVRHVVTEIERGDLAVAALSAGDYQRLGELFTASHSSLREDYQVSCAELDAAVDGALAAGALGARMTGGGFGGSAIALVPDADVDRVQDAVRAGFQSFEKQPRFFPVTAEGPATRVEWSR